MTAATTAQAMQVLEYRSYGAPERHMVAMLADAGVDTVQVYHVTKTANVAAIRDNGIKCSECYNRKPAVYVFVDPADTQYGENITGSKDYTVLTISLPVAVAASMVEDGLYNGTFDFSHSAARIERNIPAEWIK